MSWRKFYLENSGPRSRKEASKKFLAQGRARCTRSRKDAQGRSEKFECQATTAQGFSRAAQGADKIREQNSHFLTNPVLLHLFTSARSTQIPGEQGTDTQTDRQPDSQGPDSAQSGARKDQMRAQGHSARTRRKVAQGLRKVQSDTPRNFFP